MVNNYVKSYYQNLGEIIKIEQLKHNNINSTNFLVTTTKSRYVVRKVLDGSSSKKIENMCKILQFCKKNDCKVHVPIKNDFKKYSINKDKIYLTKYYEGMAFNGKLSELNDLAKNIALLHQTLKKNRISYNHRTNLNQFKVLNKYELKNIKEKLLHREKKSKFDLMVFNSLEFLIENIDSQNKLAIIEKLPYKKQLIHYDLIPDNVIFSNGKVLAIIDFNSMHVDNKIKDIALASFRFTVSKTKNVTKIEKRIRNFVKTYITYNEIEEEFILNLDYFIKQQILERISHILRSYYLYNFTSWSIDFQKNIDFLKLIKNFKM